MADTPTPDALFFNLISGNGQDYNVALFANQIFPGEVGIRTVYKAQGETEWKYVIEPSIYKEEVTTDELLRQKVAAALENINKKIVEFFLLGDEPTEPPTELIDRISALIKNSIEWDGSKLVLK